ncbi:MAG: hypothetical protein IT434_14150 [Phycisphaerales bacterium]|nr:hypothetical protein [Phycisphaerales bacterium]
MSNIAGTSMAQSIAGLNQAERTVATDRKPRTESTKPLREQLKDDVVVNTESVEAVRNLADNSKEEAHDDHQRHPLYDPHAKPHDEEHHQIDVEG